MSVMCGIDVSHPGTTSLGFAPAVLQTAMQEMSENLGERSETISLHV